MRSSGMVRCFDARTDLNVDVFGVAQQKAPDHYRNNGDQDWMKAFGESRR
jgi:hypothetical protein